MLDVSQTKHIFVREKDGKERPGNLWTYQDAGKNDFEVSQIPCLKDIEESTGVRCHYSSGQVEKQQNVVALACAAKS